MTTINNSSMPRASQQMRVADLAPDMREIAESKAVRPGATTVSVADAQQLFENYVNDNHIALTNGRVDMSEASGLDAEQYLYARKLQNLVDVISRGDVYEAPKNGLLDRLFGRIFESDPRPPSNTEGLPGGRRSESSVSMDWLDQVRGNND